MRRCLAVRSKSPLGDAGITCRSVDESYFAGKRQGKRGRGAAGKVPVFGLFTA